MDLIFSFNRIYASNADAVEHLCLSNMQGNIFDVSLLFSSCEHLLCGVK